MVIGIDASRANEKERTGTEWYSYHLIDQFKKLDSTNQFRLYTPTPLQEDLSHLPSNFQSAVLSSMTEMLWTQRRLSLEMLVNAPEVLFVPAHTIPLIHPKKTVVTCHDVGFERFPELYSGRPIGPKGGIAGAAVKAAVGLATGFRYSNNELDYHRWSMKFALRKAWKMITVSEFTKREILEIYGGDPDKIHVIHNGFDQQRFIPFQDQGSVEAVLQKYHINKPFYLFVGRLERKKNVAGIVEAFHQAQTKQLIAGDSLLILAGNPGYGYEEIKQRIDALSVQPFIRELGWIPDEDRAALLNAARAFVFPSMYEGFGIPIVEAFGCGTPVITSSRASCPEVAGDAAILVDPTKTDEIADAMGKLERDGALRERLRQKGFARAKLFSWEKCAKETLECLVEDAGHEG